MFHEFPKWVHPEGGDPVMVQSADQEAAVMQRVEAVASADEINAVEPSLPPEQPPMANESVRRKPGRPPKAAE